MTRESRINRFSPDGKQWYVVATANGEAQAAIITGLLQTAGIPVWVYRESAGAAIGLSVGVLGTEYIMTPEAYYDEAVALLESDEPPEIDLEGEDDNTIVPD